MRDDGSFLEHGHVGGRQELQRTVHGEHIPRARLAGTERVLEAARAVDDVDRARGERGVLDAEAPGLDLARVEHGRAGRRELQAGSGDEGARGVHYLHRDRAASREHDRAQVAARLEHDAVEDARHPSLERHRGRTDFIGRIEIGDLEGTVAPRRGPRTE